MFCNLYDASIINFFFNGKSMYFFRKLHSIFQQSNINNDNTIQFINNIKKNRKKNLPSS